MLQQIQGPLNSFLTTKNFSRSKHWMFNLSLAMSVKCRFDIEKYLPIIFWDQCLELKGFNE